MSSHRQAGSSAAGRRGRSRRWRGSRAALALGTVLLGVALIGLGTVALTGGQQAGAQARQVVRGEQLYGQQCASCHGPQGQGTYRGPSLATAGAASADYYLRSGRMPIDDPHEQPQRSDPAFDDEQIDALVAYVASLGEGPVIPQLDLEAADVAAGGEQYRLNCVSCHNWDGKGGALVGRGNAPDLHDIPPRQIAEAIRIGPGAMPLFSEDALGPAELDAVVAYVVELQAPQDRGGLGLGHWGPATEALAAFAGLGVLLLLTGLLGKREGS